MGRTLGVLFDYNGVIANDERLHEIAFARVLSRYGVILTHNTYRRNCLGKTDKDGFQQLVLSFAGELASVPVEDLVQQKQRTYLRLVSHDDILYPHAAEVIKALSNDVKLALVTSATLAEVLSVLGGNGLTEAFSAIITAEDIVRGKPDPEGYLKGLEALMVSPDRAIAIEDSKSGVEAAKAANVVCVAVLHTSTVEDLLIADLIVNSIADINISLLERALSAQDMCNVISC